jgi:ABC-type multidrug transport system ATPase subunit
MIRVENLTKRFGRATVVNGVSLALERGDSLALWGGNGAGKTTLIRCVLGLLTFTGRVEVAGLDVRREGKAARRLIGYVPQEIGFYDDLRVGEALHFFARLKGVAPNHAAAALDRVGLPAQQRKRIRDLSGGMKQRLALAIALLGEPPILVLDEVTASLDARGREELVALLARLGSEGRTMLFASHRPEEVAALARRVAVLEAGRLVEELPAPRFADSITGSISAGLHIARHAHREPVLEIRSNGCCTTQNGSLARHAPLALEGRINP